MSVCLHTHSWYSLLEGVSSPATLVEQAVRLGYRALALTDTNNLYGAVPFVDGAMAMGLHPILGARLRLGKESCVALIADPTGYRSLCRILSRLHLEALPPPDVLPEPISSPPTLTELLQAEPEGLHLLVDSVSLAESLLPYYNSRLWMEIVRPRPHSASAPTESALIAASQRLRLPLIASTAAHLIDPKEYGIFRLLTAVRARTLLDRLPARLPLHAGHGLLDPEAFARRFHDLPEAVQNTDRLAQMLRADVLPRQVILPQPILPHRRGNPPPPATYADQVRYLERFCRRGLRRRGRTADASAQQRLRQEMEIIESKGLAGYFLMVRDITRHARRRGHTMALRGSAGNSLVCYLLGITEVDPLRFELPMERFIHPGRVDLPDIDLDFDWKVRDQIIAHFVRRYGQRHTTQICTHQFFQPRSAFREAGRVHGLSDEQISTLLTTLESSLSELMLTDTEPPPCRRFPLEVERWPRLIASARALLGRPHHLSVHPGGVIQTPGPIADHVPLQWAAKGVVVTQMEKDGVERIGLVKIDLLGNRGLSTVDEARRLADLPMSRFPGDPALDRDPATLQLLRTGDTLGVTQLESPAMRHLLIQLRTQSIRDVIQALALVRPGAAGMGMKEIFIRRRQGLDSTRLAHPILARHLEETHGLMIYEDDALRLIQALTGLDAPTADNFRKRVARHQGDAEAFTLLQEFVALCQPNSVPPDAISEFWRQLVKFNQYAFCKSHAVSYGLIAWSGAWLKAHHPVAFWTAALNNNQGSYPRRVYIEAIRRAGIPLLPPCVNTSDLPFTRVGNAIRVGLGSIRSLPLDLQERLIADRQQRGPYRSLVDFRQRLDPGPESLALLICAGALDWTGRSRPGLFLDAHLHKTQARSLPQLFPDYRPFDWNPPEYSPEQCYRDEWHLLGFVIDRPLLSVFRPHNLDGPAITGGIPRVSGPDLHRYLGKKVRIEGLVATARHASMGDGRSMQFITLEDEYGLADVTLFPGSCLPVPYLSIGPYEAIGTVEEQYGVHTLTASSFQQLSAAHQEAG